MVPGKRARALGLPEYACARPDEVVVELPLVERAGPAASVQRRQRLPAFLDAPEAHASFGGQAPPESARNHSHKSLEARKSYAAKALFRITSVFHALIRVVKMLQGQGAHAALLMFNSPKYSPKESVAIYAPDSRSSITMAPSLGLLLLGKLAVLVSTTLAGARLRLGAAEESCTRTSSLLYECTILDSQVSHTALYAPWVLTMCMLIFLGLPTVMLESRYPETGTQTLISLFLRQTLIMFLARSLSRHTFYAVGLHACVHTLLSLRSGPHLVGGGWWWGLRFLGVVVLVYLAALYGPSVSLVPWPGSNSFEALACAALSHLLGMLLPDIFLVGEQFIVDFGSLLFSQDWRQD